MCAALMVCVSVDGGGGAHERLPIWEERGGCHTLTHTAVCPPPPRYFEDFNQRVPRAEAAEAQVGGSICLSGASWFWVFGCCTSSQLSSLR